MSDVAVAEPAAGLSRMAVLAAARLATGRIAPLWPLSRFVAVNPFLGLTDLPFAAAARRMAQVAGARLTMPRAFYADPPADGRTGECDPAVARALSFADAAGEATGQDWARLVTDRIGAWAAWRFDKGQAAWASPWRDQPAYADWRAQAALDRTAEVLGLADARKIAARLPEQADAMLAEGVTRLGLGPEHLERYFHRLLMSVAGWAGWARHLAWEAELRGGADDSLRDLLAIRLAWDCVLHDSLGPSSPARAAWARARQAFAGDPPDDPDLLTDIALQTAFEHRAQRRMMQRLAAPASASARARPSLQAAFCIDVRSEVFRRALEGVSDAVETLGVAGFFGFALECAPAGETEGPAHCPVLLAPGLLVAQQAGATPPGRGAGGVAAQAWAAFRMAAVASFAFVESTGWRYAGRLVADTLRATPSRTCPPDAPAIAPGRLGGRASGIDAETRVTLAEGLLRAMSLTGRFAPLVLLAGHGASTVNNPHAAGLDCGACGGHGGEANARVAAMVLNDPAVRSGLAARGIVVPDDTMFLAGLHDTTTDTVRLFADDAPRIPAVALDRLRGWLAQAADIARAERAARLRLAPGVPVARQMQARARDWSQMRPEWGLAGCAAFIAAPRARTAGRDLGGQAFLHCYDWRRDPGFAVLETIMTAPMVVASWINLQYYGSVVDPRAFGGGDKTLHNVVGLLGVLEGNGGDLRAGLPWQSVHDGAAWAHQPLRLSVFIDAPTAAMDSVLARHRGVRDLFDHGWIHLFALGRDTPDIHRYRALGRWEICE